MVGTPSALFAFSNLASRRFAIVWRKLGPAQAGGDWQQRRPGPQTVDVTG